MAIFKVLPSEKYYLSAKMQMLYFGDVFWYDISVDRGVKYFRQNSMHGKCAIVRRKYMQPQFIGAIPRRWE